MTTTIDTTKEETETTSSPAEVRVGRLTIRVSSNLKAGENGCIRCKKSCNRNCTRSCTKNCKTCRSCKTVRF